MVATTWSGIYYSGEAEVGGLRLHVDASTQATASEIDHISPSNRADRVAASFARLAFGLRMKRLRFTGKGYKIRKSRRSEGYRLNFGRSHKTLAFGGGLVNKKMSKQVVLLYSNDKRSVRYGANGLILVRKASPYTKRGIRCTKQLMLKRPGKKTNY